MPELREDHYRVLLLAKVSLKPNGMELVSAVLEGVPRLEVGKEFQLLENGKVKFGWNKVKLAANCHLVITLQNPSSASLILEKGEALGWGAKSEEDPPIVPSPYIPSNFSYTQLGNKATSDLKQPPTPKTISPYEPKKLSSQYAPLTPHYGSHSTPMIPVANMNVPFTNPSPPIRPKVPVIPLEPKGPRSPPEPKQSIPQIPKKDRISPQPLNRDPRGPKHKRQLPGTWGSSSSLDALAQAHQGVTRMLNEEGPPVVRPPSPTVRPERTSPPKPVPKRDPRLLAVRIEKKQAVPFSKKVLEDHGITQPQGNPKYFAPGQQFSPMLDLLPGSQKSKLWTAENRQGFLQASPLQQEPSRVGFRQEMSLVDAKKKTHPLLFNNESTSLKGDGFTTQIYTKRAGDNDELTKKNKKFRESDGTYSKDKNDNKSEEVAKVKKKSSKSSEEKSRKVNGRTNGSSAKEEIFLKKKKKKKAKEEARQDKQKTEKRKSKSDKASLEDDFIQRVWAEAALSVKTTSTNVGKNLTGNTSKYDQSSKKDNTSEEKSQKSAKVDESAILRNEDDLEDEFLTGSTPPIESDADSIDSNEDQVIIRSDIDESSESETDSVSDSSRTWTGDHKVCPLCKENFRSLQAYRLHYRSPHTDKCSQCKLVFNSEDKLEEHIEEKHNAERKKPQSVLKKATLKSESPEKVRKSDMSERVLVAKKARKVSKKRNPQKSQTLKREEDEKDEDEEDEFLDSKYCQKKCCTDFRGTFTSVVPKVVAVDDSDIPFMETVILNNDTAVVSRDMIPCKKCDLHFPTERDLFSHGVLVHQEGWTFESSKDNLVKPGDTPSGPFNCNTCRETINTWIALNKHLWQPHLFKCEYCDFAFNRNTKLEDHTNKTHNLVGLIEVTQCGLCGESFARSSSLARHVAAPHPFPCNNCEATFPTKAALKRHSAVCAKGIVEAIISTCVDNII